MSHDQGIVTLGTTQRHSPAFPLGRCDAAGAAVARTLVWLLCCVTLVACGESSETVSTSAQSGTPAAVTRSERTWVDTTRHTERNGSAPELPSRTLRTLIWQPAIPGALPLLVVAHGYTGRPEEFEAMAPRIAAAGFVVAAAAFPLTSWNASGSYLLRDVANQPADVSFVIDNLLAANGAPGDALYGRIRAGEIAVLGHSLGGTTTIALTRKDCCRDPRVRASILFAPGPVDVFPTLLGTDPIDAGPPTLILQGTQDRAIPYLVTEQLYTQIDPPRRFVGIPGADHGDAIVGSTLPLTSLQSVSERAIVAFLNAMFRGAGAELDRTLATLADEGNVVHSDGALP